MTPKPRQRREEQEQEAYFRFLALHEERYPVLRWIHAIPNGGHRSKATAGRMKATGQKAGVWDVYIPVVTEGFAGCYLEFKIPPNKLTAAQERFRDEVIDRGWFYGAVCHDWIRAARVTMDYLGIVDAAIDDALRINAKGTL